MLPDPELARHPFRLLLERAERTLTRTIEYCDKPNGSASDSVEETLTLALRLWAMYRVVEDHCFDFNLLGANDCLDDLRNKVHALGGRFERGGPRTDIVGNLANRFVDDVRELLRLDHELRKRIATEFDVDAVFGFIEPRALVSACFTAALSLEAHYEQLSDARMRPIVDSRQSAA